MFDILMLRLFGKWKRSYVAEVVFKGKKVLDVGCGFGDFLKFNPKKFVGIDINADALRSCKEEGFEVHNASVTKIPFSNDSFDGVNCQQVIEHLTAPDAYGMLTEINRVLKKGGLLVISTEMVTKRFWNTFSHIKPYPPTAIKKLLRHSGQETFGKLSSLKVERVYYSGIPFKNSFLSLFFTLLAHYLGIGRINYTMILRKL